MPPSARSTTAIRNVYNWRVKETERMVAVVTELRKLGATVEEGRDYCIITPPKQVGWEPLPVQAGTAVCGTCMRACVCVSECVCVCVCVCVCALIHQPSHLK